MVHGCSPERQRAGAGILAFLLLVICVGGSALAQASIAVTPAKIEKRIGRFLFLLDNKIGPIRITNTGDEPVVVTVSVRDLFHNSDGAPIFLEAREYTYGMSELISLSATRLRLLPGQTEEVEGRVEVPSEREGGGYAVVLFEAAADTGGSPEMKCSGRIGVLTYVTFPGTAIVEAEAVNARILADPDEPLLEILVRNLGNIHIKASGMGAVENDQGECMVVFDMPPATVLPNAERWIRIPLEALPEVDGKISVNLALLPNPWSVFEEYLTVEWVEVATQL